MFSVNQSEMKNILLIQDGLLHRQTAKGENVNFVPHVPKRGRWRLLPHTDTLDMSHLLACAAKR